MPVATLASDTEAPVDEYLIADEGDDASPLGAEREFCTDFSKHSIPYSEILSGGPPKDGIPAIDIPKFVSVEEAGKWPVDGEPVILLQVDEDVRAYPVQILIWHEIVNDTVGGVPLTITFCPLCNTAIVFEREVNGQVLDFGTTGSLRNSNLILFKGETPGQLAVMERVLALELSSETDACSYSLLRDVRVIHDKVWWN